MRDVTGRDMSASLDRYITGNYGEDQFDDGFIEVGEVTPGMIVKTYGKSVPKEVQKVRQSGEYIVLNLIDVYGKNSVASIKIGGTVERWDDA